MPAPLPTLLAILGPTAVGKSAVALRLAQQLGRSLLSADSRQLYRYMDIGTNKPTAAELALVPHFLINHLTPDQPYNAARYADDALAIIQQHIKQKKPLPILVGGTGFYVQALEQGFDNIPEVDPDVRQQLRHEMATQPLTVFTEEIRRADPQTYASIDLHNPARVGRALEVIRSTGRPYSSYKTGAVAHRPFALRKLALQLPREQLYDRINQRVHQMVAAGLVAEVQALLDAGYAPTLPALQTIGYAEIVTHLQGQLSLDQAIASIQQNTRRYAKRQLTWLRRDASTLWCTPDDWDTIAAHATHALQ